MHALVYTKPNQVKLKEIEAPELKSGYTKIRVTYCGVCGGDIGIFHGKHPRATAPLVIGT